MSINNTNPADTVSFASVIEQLPENKLWEDFTDKNMETTTEICSELLSTTHYHLGQIVLIKKMLPHPDKN